MPRPFTQLLATTLLTLPFMLYSTASPGAGDDTSKPERDAKAKHDRPALQRANANPSLAPDTDDNMPNAEPSPTPDADDNMPGELARLFDPVPPSPPPAPKPKVVKRKAPPRIRM